MRKLSVGALLATLVWVAVFASSAIAGEWLWSGEPIAAPLPTTLTGELLLEDMGAAAKVDILCSGIFDGTIGPGVTDLITDILNLNKELEETTNLAGAKVNAINCILQAKGSCKEANESLIWVIPINLPWPTELLLVSTELWWDDFLANPELGEPGYEVSCETTLLGLVTDICLGLPVADLTNEEGGVHAIFEENEANNPPGNCSLGGEKQVLTVGEGLIEHETGGVLSLS